MGRVGTEAKEGPAVETSLARATTPTCCVGHKKGARDRGSVVCTVQKRRGRGEEKERRREGEREGGREGGGREGNKQTKREGGRNNTPV